ncbi:hypothetical protein UFOVP398_63 [uncultured Caudovirales phage]|uniref:Uncharacterized protein n=1 Tax=uncultured Caudovirales phage TaxID=2100421 RepID=A0A6J5M367_9CAUD|nr:hypothetical protein UFOVP398_63 [uncultured Caudovirales phage]
MKFTITKTPTFGGGTAWSGDPENRPPRLVEGWVYPAQPLFRRQQQSQVVWASAGRVSPDEARAFANAVIEIADAVEAEAERLGQFTNETIKSANAVKALLESDDEIAATQTGKGK